jgi:hypothetical protein
VQLFRENGPPGESTEFELLALLREDPEQSVRRIERQYEFDAEVSVRWIWQDALPIDELSKQDRESIARLFNRYLKIYDKSFSISRDMKHVQANWHVGEKRLKTPYPGPDIDRFLAAVDRLKANEKYEVDSIKPTGMELIVGNRIVLAVAVDSRKYGEILELKPLIEGGVRTPEGDWSAGLRLTMERLYFVKMKDGWRLLNFDWRY